MSVQIVLLLVVAVALLMPWRLATRRRCEVCRSTTPRRLVQCRACGAAPPAAPGGWLEIAPAESGRWTREQLDQLGQSLWGPADRVEEGSAPPATPEARAER